MRNTMTSPHGKAAQGAVYDDHAPTDQGPGMKPGEATDKLLIPIEYIDLTEDGKSVDAAVNESVTHHVKAVLFMPKIGLVKIFR